jgi:hypothetical protein
LNADAIQLAQPIGLFFIALMDHWVNVTMSARRFAPIHYNHKGSRYGMGLCVLYFLLSAIAVDVTLQSHWEENFKLSDEKLFDFQHVELVTQDWTRYTTFSITSLATQLISLRRRRRRWANVAVALYKRVSCIFALTTIFLWLLVEDGGQIIMYYAYIVGYTGVLVFQVSHALLLYIRLTQFHPVLTFNSPSSIVASQLALENISSPSFTQDSLVSP